LFTRTTPRVLQMNEGSTHRYRGVPQALTPEGGLTALTLPGSPPPDSTGVPFGDASSSDWLQECGPALRCPRIRGAFRHLHVPTGQPGPADDRRLRDLVSSWLLDCLVRDRWRGRAGFAAGERQVEPEVRFLTPRCTTGPVHTFMTSRAREARGQGRPCDGAHQPVDVNSEQVLNVEQNGPRSAVTLSTRPASRP